MDFTAKVVSDCDELLARSFEILHNFLRDHIRDQEDWRCLRGDRGDATQPILLQLTWRGRVQSAKQQKG